MLIQPPQTVQVGRVSATYWPDNGALATALAEYADREVAWPGLPAPPERPIRLILVPDETVFDSVNRGRLPEWGAGAAYPATNTIVVRAGPNVRQILRHELAHLALREVVGRAPLWFEEGYASRASAEWDRLVALQVNWSVARRRVPSLAQLNQDLRGGVTRAGAGYALATTAVLLLERLGKDAGLSPLLRNLTGNLDFDAALRQTYAITLDQFEEMWRRDLRSRYGWLLFFTSFGIFWSVVLAVVMAVWIRRRRRDRVRRAALDDGWIVDGQDSATS